MGLDIYVGSFTRYYSGDWESAAARVARELGASFQVIRPNEPDVIPNRRQIQDAVAGWRSSLSAVLGEALAQPLDWDESPETPYFTDRPDWDGYTALQLWAAYEEHPQLRIPIAIPESLAADPGFSLSASEGFKTRYPDLLCGTQIWLPLDFSLAFKATDCAGRDVMIGSSVSLVRQLDELNRRTWNSAEAGEPDVVPTGFSGERSLEISAFSAFSQFRRCARLSLDHHLPMLLDW